MSSNRISPNQREVISATDSITGKQVYPTATNNKLDVNATASLAGSSLPISGASTAVGVAIVDSSGNQISSFGGGTQYTTGSAQATPTGTVALGWDGTDVKALPLDGSGYLEVNVKAGSGSGLSVTDEAAFTAGTSAFVPAGGTYNSSNATLTSGQQGTVNLTADRAFHTNLRNSTGTEIGTASTPVQVSLANTATNSTAVKVDGSGVTQPVSGTFYQATQPVSGTVTANAGTNLNTSLLALETGGNLAAIKTDTDKIPSQGQALAAASMPVVLPAAQITTLTPPAAITNYALETGGNLATLVGDMTNGTQTSKLTDGTNTANVVAGDSGYNGVTTASATKTMTFTTSTSGAQNLGQWNCEGFSYVEVVYTSVGVGLAVAGQFCPTSGGTYVSSSTFGGNTTSYTPSALGNAVNTIYFSAIHGNYFQLAVTALTSGTFAGTVTFRNTPPPYSTLIASSIQNGNWNVGQTGIWSVQGQQNFFTGTITTSSSSITSTSQNGFGQFALISVHGTYAGVSFGITQSDDGGTTFYNAPIYDATAMQWLAGGTTITPGTNASKMYWVAMTPYANEIKVLASAYTSGTANIRITYSLTNQPGSTMSQIMDSAGNARGANVDASNNLMVNIGAGSIANTSFAATQATAANLNATVVGTGTFAVQAAQSGSWTVGTTSAAVNVGQKTVSTTATQLSATSTVPTNGIIVRALSTNTASIFVGGSGVTTSTGYELVAGEATSFTCNLNTLYIISAASTTDKACWNVE